MYDDKTLLSNIERGRSRRVYGWDRGNVPSNLMTPFHRTTGLKIRFNCIVHTHRGNIRTFVRPGFVGRTFPPSARPPCHRTGTETEGRVGTIPCIDYFVPNFLTSLRIISPCAQYRHNDFIQKQGIWAITFSPGRGEVCGRSICMRPPNQLYFFLSPSPLRRSFRRAGLLEELPDPGTSSF